MFMQALFTAKLCINQDYFSFFKQLFVFSVATNCLILLLTLFYIYESLKNAQTLPITSIFYDFLFS